MTTTSGPPGSSGSGRGDASFDRYARMVRRAMGVPVGLVVFVEDDRQVFAGAVGLPEPYQSTRETPLSHSFCQEVVQDSRPLVVADARRDERLRDNPAVEDLGVVAYAGWPLVDHHGSTIGAVCAVDAEPRKWTAEELAALEDLAAACSAEIAQRELRLLAGNRLRAERTVLARTRVLHDLSEGLADTRTIHDVADAVQRTAHDGLGAVRAGLWLRSSTEPTQMPPPAPPQPGVPTEALTHVPTSRDDWGSASRFRVLGVNEDNPVGAALLRGGPVVYARRRDQDARFPHLANPDQEGDTRVFHPLEVAGQLYGVLVLVWPEGRTLAPDDQVTVTALAAYTAMAVQRALLLEERVEVASRLQRAMLTTLPHPDSLQLAARYLPAAERDQVGGDWYDAVIQPDGRTSIMVGDVMGHDMAAAARMGELRSMLRALAWVEPDGPSINVARLDRAALDLGLDCMATLVFGRLEQSPEEAARGDHTLQWTSAGHFAPVLVTVGGEVTELGDGDSHDLMLGVEPSLPRRDQRSTIPAGATLLLYTDGLVERRDRPIDDGIALLLGAVRRHRALPLEELLDVLVAEVAGDQPIDDVAVLAVRTDPVS